MLKTPSTARRAKLFAAAGLAAYVVGATVAHAGVTAIGAGAANEVSSVGDPSLYPNPKDPVAANSTSIGDPSLYPNPKDPVGANSPPGIDPGNSNSGGSDPKVAGAPEPASWALMALGFAGLGFVAHRAKRRPALI